ncbi:MAG TPA: response regulator, partial [Polyangiaceae bacterium]
SVFFYGIGTVVAAFTLYGRQTLILLPAGCVCFALALASTMVARPKAVLAAWLIVAPALLASHLGFAVMGFLAGPAVVLVVTLVIGGLLLGKRVMVTLGAASLAILGGIGWAMVHRDLPTPEPASVSMTHAVPWFRTISLMFLAIGLLGTLLIEVVGRIALSLEQARSETVRREQAERARAEAEIVSVTNRQLEIVGQLAAGIAHDFNNNLTAIIGSAELLDETLPKTGLARDLLDDILTSSRGAAELTRQLLIYARKAQMVLVPTDIHQCIENTLSLLRRSIEPKIEIAAHLQAERHIILADTVLLDNSLLNLCVNARDAMPDGGRLTVATSNVDVLPGKHERLSPGTYLLLEVLDTGHGMPPEVLGSIFDPFFTTKPVGEGTGLGLAAVSGTVKSMRGHIDVESELGYGSAFRIFLPCHSLAEKAITKESSQLERGSGRILLVDDDALVRRTAEAALRNLGYEVTLAADGLAAVETCRSDALRFDLVILDLRMPHMDGACTFDELRRLDATVPVLVWSGYGGEMDVHELLRKGAVGFIQKPYRVADLSRRVAEAMRAR